MRISLLEYALMHRSWIAARCWMPVLILAGGLVSVNWAQPLSKAPPPPEARFDRAVLKKFVTQHCSRCHNSDDKTAGLDLDAVCAKAVDAHPEVWEKVVRKLAARQMPPLGKRPD